MALIRSIFNTVFDLAYFMFKGSIAYARKKGVTIGEHCRIYIKSWGSEPFLIHLGNHVTVTSGVKFITHDGSTCLVYDAQGKRYQRFAPIHVGSNVFIGVNIANNVVVGACSLVSKSLPEAGVYVGTPAKKIK